MEQMDKIERILENSVFTSNMFNSSQIKILNIMAENISIEQLGIIANPDITDVTYSILADYLYNHSISAKEFNNYMSVDINRTNDIILNVYLGKLHNLTDDQIQLYTNKNIKNIKIARLLVEKFKDSVDLYTLHKLINGTFASNSLAGRYIIQDCLNDEISVKKLLIIQYVDSVCEDFYYMYKDLNETQTNVIKDAIENYDKINFDKDITLYIKELFKSFPNIDHYVNVDYDCIKFLRKNNIKFSQFENEDVLEYFSKCYSDVIFGAEYIFDRDYESFLQNEPIISIATINKIYKPNTIIRRKL